MYRARLRRLLLGNGRPAASPDEQPPPIASLAKVMTAYLTLKRDPSGWDSSTVSTAAPLGSALMSTLNHDR